MAFELIVNWIVCGFVVGLLARALVPGRQKLGCLMTTSLGIVGSLAGGFAYSKLRPETAVPFSLDGQNWYGWGVSILGAVLVLLAGILLSSGAKE